ncbi:histidine kinase [Streptomyces sp. Ru62]|uniref:sensor histidine kinase n=1 Tax=Streptomyces sp. Ru62 TaxID=2080745 RepID=UPI000CDCFE8C|nr:PAS domain-containing protein [Streptomyces sp. Ru62]POX64358.1 histidine kinase [Streptomyces sp. Ru62]
MTSVADDLGSILDVIQQPAWAVDTDHRVTYANPPAAEFMGYERPSDLLGTDGRPAEHAHGRSRGRAVPEPTPSHRGTLTHADGSLLPVEWSLIPLTRPGGPTTVYVFRTGTGTPADRREPKEEGPPRTLVARLDADRHRRVARSLQHGAQERLASALLGLNLAREHLDGERVPSSAAELLDGAIQDAERALSQVRDVTAELYPGVLRLRGLPAALTVLAGQWPVPVGVSGNLRERLPHAVEMHTYFLVREALGRAVHGAGARRVQVVAELDLDLVVTVADDGAAPGEGLDSAPLAAMADRVAVLDGSLSVRHASGEGTTVCAVIPVQSHTGY